MENDKLNILSTDMTATLKTTKAKYFAWVALTTLVVSWFILDMLTKIWAKSSLAHGPGRELIDGWLQFTYAENHAGAWGLFSFVSQDTRSIFLTVMSVVSILIICFFVFSFLREQQTGFKISSKYSPESTPESYIRKPITSSAATEESSGLLKSTKKSWPISANEGIMIFGFASLLGGALGNLHDRLRWGYVVDFIDWHKGVEWPIFNVADIAITLGMIFLAIFLFTNNTKIEKTMDQVKNQQPEKLT